MIMRHHAETIARGIDPRPYGTWEAGLGWQVEALCAQADPEAFFPAKGGRREVARGICGRCPVQSECLDYALVHHEQWGIWGGMGERERRELKRKASA